MAETEETAPSNSRNPELIRICLRNVVKEAVEAISADEFQTILGTLEGNTCVAQKLYQMQQSIIVSDIHHTINYMCTASDTDAKYSEITTVLSTSVNTEAQAWRPTTGDCEMQLYAHRKRILDEKKQTLEKMVEEERTSRLQLRSALDRQRSLFNNQCTQLSCAQAKLCLYYDNLMCNDS